MSNKDIYETSERIRHYYLRSDLLNPEETILNLFKNKLKNMKMLDVGVGGGRTTLHFANLTKEYIGIDYSEKMINACKKRFPNIHFKLCDVRNMKIFEDNHFDFILFSMNGLDSISHEDRLISLKEIKRVCKNRGYFFFSSHNLQCINKIFKFRLFSNPIKVLRKRLLNKNYKDFKNKNHVLICGLDSFKTYYIKPGEQLKQLNNLGFKNIKVYSQNGEEIEDKFKLDTTTDYWLSYLCNK